mgnify:CR=1 FL=1
MVVVALAVASYFGIQMNANNPAPKAAGGVVVVEATDAGARIVEANLYKLVNVLRVDDLTHKSALMRELGLVKVKVTPQTRAQVLQLVEVFRARVVDVDEETPVLRSLVKHFHKTTAGLCIAHKCFAN